MEQNRLNPTGLAPRTALVGLLMAAILSGCASNSVKAPVEPVQASEVAPVDQPAGEQKPEEVLAHIDPKIIYLVGSAEILGQRKDFKNSAEYYAQAAALSDDPAIAARAVQVSAFAEDSSLTETTVKRWLELSPGNPEPHRYALILALRDGDDEVIWTHLRGMLTNNRDPEVWSKLANILAGARDRGAAARALDRMVVSQIIPRTPPALAAYSDLAVQLNRLELADVLATEVISLSDENAAAYLWRARIRTTLERLDEAKADFAEAVRLDPDNQTGRQSYATLLAETGDYEGALAELAEIDPDMRVLYQQALYAQSAELPERALEHFAQLEALPVEDEDEKYFFLGQLAENLELESDRIVEIYNKVRSGERLSNARLRTAVVLADDGKLRQARAILRRLKNGTEETAANAYLTEASLVRRYEGDEEAMAVYDDGVAMLPDNRSLLFARSLHAETIDRIDVAEADLRKVLEQNPDDASALNALGYTLADRTDRYDEALVLLERAYELQPDQAAIVDSLGWVHYKLGNLEQSLEYLRYALQLQFDSEIAAHLGEVLWVTGEIEEAESVWQDALQRDPDSDIVKETRSRFVGQAES